MYVFQNKYFSWIVKKNHGQQTYLEHQKLAIWFFWFKDETGLIFLGKAQVGRDEEGVYGREAAVFRGGKEAKSLQRQ